MPKSKWLDASLVVSSAMVVITAVLLGGSRLGNDGIVAAAVLFEGGDPFKTGQTIKIISKSDFPTVGIDLINSKTEKTASSISCQPKDYLTRYFGGSSTKYKDHLVEAAICLKGRLMGTFYNQQMAHDRESVVAVSTMIGAMQRQMAFAAANKEAKTAKFYIIPGGLDAVQDYAYANNIEMKCLKDKNSGNLLAAETGTGMSDRQNGSKFSVTSPEQDKMIADIKAANAKIKKALDDHEAANKIKIAKGEKPDSLGVGTIISMVSSMSSMGEKMADKLVAILPDDLKLYPELANSENYVEMTLDLDVDKDKKFIDQTETIPGMIKFLLKTKDKSGNTNGRWLSGSMTVDKTKYPSIGLPVDFLAQKNDEAANINITRLTKMKNRYELRLTQNEAKYKSLKDKNFDCPS